MSAFWFRYVSYIDTNAKTEEPTTEPQGKYNKDDKDDNILLFLMNTYFSRGSVYQRIPVI